MYQPSLGCQSITFHHVTAISQLHTWVSLVYSQINGKAMEATEPASQKEDLHDVLARLTQKRVAEDARASMATPQTPTQVLTQALLHATYHLS